MFWDEGSVDRARRIDPWFLIGEQLPMLTRVSSSLCSPSAARASLRSSSVVTLNLSRSHQFQMISVELWNVLHSFKATLGLTATYLTPKTLTIRLWTMRSIRSVPVNRSEEHTSALQSR